MTIRKFKGVLISISQALKPLALTEIKTYEGQLGLKFPNDYRDFLCSFGAGYMEPGIEILHPADITPFADSIRTRLTEHWFWEHSPEILTKDRALECFPFFGDDMGADILFHPSDPSRWFILPSADEFVLVMHSLQELCDYFGPMVEDVTEPYEFEPKK